MKLNETLENIAAGGVRAIMASTASERLSEAIFRTVVSKSAELIDSKESKFNAADYAQIIGAALMKAFARVAEGVKGSAKDKERIDETFLIAYSSIRDHVNDMIKQMEDSGVVMPETITVGIRDGRLCD